jgi:hypothetical protein
VSTLWVFGDSFTEGFNVSTQISNVKLNPLWRESYIKWKGYIPQVFNTILADKLNMKTQNIGITSIDNYTIFHKIIEYISSIKSNDIVIIGWSSIQRFRVANNNNQFEPISGHWNNLNDNELRDRGVDISKKTINEIFVNRLNTPYIDEINDYIKIIKLLLKSNKLIFWSPFYDNLKMGMQITPIPQLKSIKDETKNKLSDLHFCESAHFELAEHFYSILNNYNKNSLI